MGQVGRREPGPGPFHMIPIRVSPILEKGGWFVAFTEGWQPVFIRVQSMMRYHLLYHPTNLWRSRNTVPTREACSEAAEKRCLTLLPV